MAYLNENYLKLQAGYLFPEVARRVREFCQANPKAAERLIRCGIGDVTEPLPRAAIDAMKQAVEELGVRETFHGYGPEQGYEFLRSAITQNGYRDRNIEVADAEIFVSDGSKCDCGYILDILGNQNKVAVPDPVYPVYVDTNVMAGHTGPARKDGSYERVVYLPCTANKRPARSCRLFWRGLCARPSHLYRRRPDKLGQGPRLCFGCRECRECNRNRILIRPRQKFRRRRLRCCGRDNRSA